MNNLLRFPSRFELKRSGGVVMMGFIDETGAWAMRPRQFSLAEARALLNRGEESYAEEPQHATVEVGAELPQEDAPFDQ